MPRFSKETQQFLESAGTTKVLQPMPASASRIIPGDILIFRYFSGVGAGSQGQRVILIVKSRRGDGVFPGLNGKLVSCFKLDGDSDAVVDAILENLYKKRRAASYYGKIKQSLIKLLGIDSFRTYKLDQMKQIFKVAIK
tara:strand:- start:736 stop:1152 length:417 start_codon:yes stop_codon:yes gene_type:complete